MAEPSSSPSQAAPSKSRAYTGAAPSKDDSNMAILLYVLCILTGFVGPLIIWLIKKDSSQFINDQGKEVLNWFITMLIVCTILAITVIGSILIPVVLLVAL